MIILADRLDGPERAAVERLASQGLHCEGRAPLSQGAVDALVDSRSRHAFSVSRSDPDPTGYAICFPTPAGTIIELATDPTLQPTRRRAEGRTLIARLGQACPANDHAVWLHGDPAGLATELIERGWPVRRELLVLTRGLPSQPDSHRGLPTSQGFAVRPFDGPGDIPAIHRVNARAFTDLPDQAAWTTQDFDRRTGAPDFDPADLLVLTDPAGEVAGFHWTAHHPAGDAVDSPHGEVFILAVDPDFRGQGLGTVLLQAGLERLSEAGERTVKLFVDTSNTAAMSLYRAAGFGERDRDVLLGVPDRDDG